MIATLLTCCTMQHSEGHLNFRSRIFSAALLFGALLASPLSAETIQLGITGNAQVGTTFLNFGSGTASDGGPYYAPPGYGAFTVLQSNTGTIFQTLGITVDQTGMIQSFSTLSPFINAFMTFDGSTVSMTGTVAPGDFGPFFLQDTNFGAVAGFNLSGDILSGNSTVASYTGTFAASFNGVNAATLLSELASGDQITFPYVGSFSATVTPVNTPEPGSILLLGAGLIGAGLWARRKRK